MLRFYEFFAGAGLVRAGLAHDWSPVWANDNDPDKRAVYGLNYNLDSWDGRDVAEVRVGDLPPGADMAWASFPCQDLSLAGWRRGMSAGRSGTFWAFWGLMRDLYDRHDRPPVIVIENVVGLLHSDSFVGLCEALAALGMQFGPLVIDARYFLPQSRPRVFVVAVDARTNSAPFVTSTASTCSWFPKAVHAAQAALPPRLLHLWRFWDVPRPTEPPPALADIIADNPSAVPWHSVAETEHVLGLMSAGNRAKIDAALSLGGRAVGLLYRRTRAGQQRAEVRFDGIAGCLRTPTGGSSRQTVVIVSAGRVRSRLLAPREAAALMGAPDYALPPNYNSAYKAMGDGVAVPVVDWLSRHLLVPLAAASRQPASRQPIDASRGLPTGSRRTADDLAARWLAAHR